MLAAHLTNIKVLQGGETLVWAVIYCAQNKKNDRTLAWQGFYRLVPPGGALSNQMIEIIRALSLTANK
jgi:hypothetical protein